MNLWVISCPPDAFRRIDSHKLVSASHDVDLVARELEALHALAKSLIEGLVEGRWTTDPDLGELAGVDAKFFVNVVRLPARQGR